MIAPTDAIGHELQALLERRAKRPPLKQAIAAVQTVDHSFEWAGAVGEYDDGTPIQPDAPFFIASIDKLFNATIAMRLWEHGTLDLDATIVAYLPPRLTRGLHRMDGIDYSDRITIRHLLGHTSGLADWLEDRPTGGRSLVERIISEGDRAVSLDDVAQSVRDELSPHFPPQDLSRSRARVRYSDTNYMMLCAVLEAVTGEPLHRVHERLLIRPLNLRHTWFAGHSQSLDPTPPPVVLRVEGRPFHIPLLSRSIWGMYSTTADTLAFLRRFVRAEVFDQPTTLASMQRIWHRFSVPLDRAALRAPGWPTEYSLGLMRFRLPRILVPWHPMPAVLGHTGSTGCWLFHCPEQDVVLAGSVDEVTAGALPYRLVPHMLRILARSSVRR
jgi:CubicO group peptidase (beta-lactamase class C family)